MEKFSFYNPTKILFGPGTIPQIGAEIAAGGVKKVLLLYGQQSIFKNGVYDAVAASLEANGIARVELGGVQPNPRLSKVREAIELARREEVEGILAVGGGSVIDSAKAIAGGALYSGDVWDIFERKGFFREALPIYTVLTLSATGSEMNPMGVITKEDENKKWGFGSPVTYPKVSVIDPTVQFSLPPEQTVNGAVDTMAHTFEFYMDPAADTDIQDEIAEGILRTVMKHVQILLKEPENYQSRAQLAWSSTLALNGLNRSGRFGGDWACHDIEHSLSAYYDIAHGAGLAIVFPAWMKYVYQTHLDKFVRLGEKVFGITEGSQEEKALGAIAALKDFFRQIGAPVTLKEVGIPRQDLPKVAANAAQRGPLGRLRKLEEKDVLAILEIAYE